MYHNNNVIIVNDLNLYVTRHMEKLYYVLYVLIPLDINLLDLIKSYVNNYIIFFLISYTFSLAIYFIN